jgi:Aerotolerance regulator N-terminal/von Willebrand factor type A domain
MGFLSPWFLAGVAAVGLPIWLHLLRRHRNDPQPFSSLMFFERRIQSSVRHRRLRYLALLALRMLLLIAVALAFASPYINRSSEVAGRRRLSVIAIDRSFSMREGDRLTAAKLEAHRIINGLPGRSLAQVVAFDSRVEVLTPPELDPASLHAAVDTIQPGDGASSYGEFVRALRVLGQSTGMQLSVHLVSDMQATSMPASFRDLQLGPHTGLEMHPVGKPNIANWAVETVTTAAHIYETKHTRLNATIAGWQTQPTTRRVALLLDQKPLASKEVTIPAGGHSQVEFTGFEVPYGAHRGQIRIEPHDGLTDDDTFAFAVERSDPRRLLFLYAQGRSRESFYYKAAIESETNTGLLVQATPVEQAANIDFTKFAYVVLNDVGELDEKTAQSLCGYVQHGGAALITLGTNTARAGRIPLSSEHLTEAREVQGSGFVDDQDPALFGAGRFENVQFFRSARLTPKANARVSARFADGTPLVVEKTMGEGRVLIFASTLDNTTNDFPLHSSFVPFVVQTGKFLAGGEESTSSVVVGTPVSLRRTRDANASADVVGPEGKRELSLSEASRALSFDLNRSGFYEVQRANRQKVLMAVHADRRESDLATIPKETLELWRNTGNTSSVAETGAMEHEKRPWNLWRYVLILAAMAGLAESIFASRYLRKETQRHDSTRAVERLHEKA